MERYISFRSEQRLTQKEFFAWSQGRPPSDAHTYELIQGRIVMTPLAGMVHARTGARLTRILGNHVQRNDLGLVLDGSAGYDLPTGDTVEPDVAFISGERLAAASASDPESLVRFVPDLVVEILSRSTARCDRTEKKRIYEINGVREYWLVDPQTRTVVVFRLGSAGVYDAGTTIASGDVTSTVLPGLAVTADEIFAD